MPGDFGEFTVNIGLGINFLAGGTLFLNSNDTLSYTNMREGSVQIQKMGAADTNTIDQCVQM